MKFLTIFAFASVLYIAFVDVNGFSPGHIDAATRLIRNIFNIVNSGHTYCYKFFDEANFKGNKLEICDMKKGKQYRFNDETIRSYELNEQNYTLWTGLTDVPTLYLCKDEKCDAYEGNKGKFPSGQGNIPHDFEEPHSCFIL
jgi:hypothetical protein